MNACKQDTERPVIVLVYYNCVCVCEAMSVSQSGIHPCVLWTEFAALADVGKCSRSGEEVSRISLLFSYTLPLLLWHTS